MKMRKKSKNRAILEELAEADFGNASIPAELRGEARRLAKEIGCTPEEALKRARENLHRLKESEEALKKHHKAFKKSKKSAKISKNDKKHAEVGRPTFSGTVQGGAPGLKSQK